jgi:hypothetical protein
MAIANDSIGNVQLQPRDIGFLRGLFESRIMTLGHIATLHFDGKAEMAKKRVQKLKAAGYIAERPRHSSAPSVLYLTGKSLDLLQAEGQLAGYPLLTRTALVKRAQVSDLTLKHELDVMEVKAALVSAIRKTDSCTVAEFTTWPLLYEFTVRRSAIDPSETGDITVKPDAFIRIHEAEPPNGLLEHSFYLELDRSTETLEKLVRKALCYRQHYASGGFAKKHGRPAEEYKQFPFIVLFVCKSRERQDNAVAALLAANPPILKQVWLTTFDEITSNPLTAIWIRPVDSRQVPEFGRVPKSRLLVN